MTRKRTNGAIKTKEEVGEKKTRGGRKINKLKETSRFQQNIDKVLVMPDCVNNPKLPLIDLII